MLPVLHLGCNDQEFQDNSEVARVGSEIITAYDFRLAYELAPPGAKISTQNILQRKKAFLNTMIENKLYAIAGSERHLEQEERIQRILKWHEREAVIKELYREEVKDQVKITDEQIREAYILLNQRLFLRQLIFNSEEEANKVYHRLNQGDTFEQIALEYADSDEKLRRILFPQEFNWGELDEQFELAAYGLNLNEVSVPLKSNIGYHLVQLVNRKENLILTESGFRDRAHYIETVIRRRREAEFAKQYAKSILEEMQPKANGPLIKELTEQANTILGQKKLERPVLPAFQSLIVRSDLGGLLEEVLVVFKDGSWTVADFFDRIEQMPPARRPELTNPGKLTNSLAIMVRDEFMANEGYKRKLEAQEKVQQEVDLIRRELTAEKMKAILLDSVQVNKEEIEKFYHENLSRYQIPERVNIREIMVRDKKLADSLLNAIQQGSKMSMLSQQYSVRKWAAKKNGELGYFTIDAFGDLGKKAFELEVNELAGPVEITIDNHVVGYSIFKVLDRKAMIAPPLQQVYNKVAADALRQKKERIRANFLENMKQHYPVYVDGDVLSFIKTTEESGSGRPMDLIVLPR